MSGMHLSKEFFELLKAIGESKSKQEEDRIIAREVHVLKKKLETPISKKSHVPGGPGSSSNPLATSKKKSKEFLVRLLYVEMLGHDGGFGYIKAVELAASSSIMHKRTGYLVCGAVLAPEHEFRFMLVNQMQRDLTSTHVLEACAALLAATKLITSDMVPAISSQVVTLLGHASEVVRKKAVIALHRFHQIAPDAVSRIELVDNLRRVLCDRDPSVMGSSLNVIEAMAGVDPTPFKDLVPSLISILKQIIEHRLPSDYDYHRVPAPWMQMKLVRILALLGNNDSSTSNGMYEILADCMKKADVGINAGYAVVYECVRTITAIYPNPVLLDAAAEAISRFISSRSQNLKYLGITGLAGIVTGHPQYAAAHQLAVIECLEDQDETLQRKTLDLLYRMTNPVNVEFITEKLLHFLRGSTDPYLRRDLTKKICSIAERFAPSNAWYVRTVTELFEISGEMVSSDVAQNLMTLIAEGTGDGDEDADVELRRNAVEIYAKLLDQPPAKLPRLLAETTAWVLGEYAYLSTDLGLDDILSKLCKLARTGGKRWLAPSTRRVLLTAIMKLVAQAGTCPPDAARVIDDYSKSRDVDLQQRCLEFQALLISAPQILGEVLPVDASCEDVQADPNLPFLDMYVSEALANGAKDYDPPEDDDDDDYGGGYSGVGGSSESKSAFNLTPYEKPTAPSAGGFGRPMGGMGTASGNGVASASGVTPPPGAGYGAGSGSDSLAPIPVGSGTDEPELELRNVKANVWGKGGLNVQSAPPAPSASSSSSAAIGGGFSSPAPAPAPSSYGGAGFGSNQVPPPQPVKTAQQIEKERQAAALFGGIGPGSSSAPPSSASAPPSQSSSTSRGVGGSFGSSSAPPAPAPAPPPAPAPAPPPAPAPAPAPAPEVDLLDMGFDVTPTPVPAAPAIDVFAAAPQPIPSEPPQPPPPAETPAAPPPPPAVAADPFAAEGLLGDVSDAPLATLPSSGSKFEFEGQVMAPMPIETSQFGQKWGTCPETTPMSLETTKIDTLAKFMDLCGDIGLHKVESIAATNEGISAGMLKGSIVVLVHGKVSPQHGGGSKLDVTIKSTNGNVGGCLSMFMQNMMR